MSPDELKQIYERKVHAVRTRPSAARASGEATVRMTDTLACDVRCCDGTVVRVGLPEHEGGDGGAPTPGQLMRASIGACLAMGYRLWSARLEIPIDDVAVDLHFETDLRGQLGVEPDILPGWNKLVYTVRLTTAAPAADVERLVQIADRTSAMLGNLRTEVERVRTIEIIAPAKCASHA